MFRVRFTSWCTLSFSDSGAEAFSGPFPGPKAWTCDGLVLNCGISFVCGLHSHRRSAYKLPYLIIQLLTSTAPPSGSTVRVGCADRLWSPREGLPTVVGRCRAVASAGEGAHGSVSCQPTATTRHLRKSASAQCLWTQLSGPWLKPRLQVNRAAAATASWEAVAAASTELRQITSGAGGNRCRADTGPGGSGSCGATLCEACGCCEAAEAHRLARRWPDCCAEIGCGGLGTAGQRPAAAVGVGRPRQRLPAANSRSNRRQLRAAKEATGGEATGNRRQRPAASANGSDHWQQPLAAGVCID